MMRNTILIFFLLWISGLTGLAQELSLSQIIDTIEDKHPVVNVYNAEIRSMDEAAKGARSWMPPEVNSGFWMVPYDPALWSRRNDGATGMGSFMIGAQQMFPNKKKLDADEAFMQAMSSVEKENKKAFLNELIHEAKQLYYEWIILEKKLDILAANEKLIEFMIQNAEIRYKNGLGKISAYYKAKAALANLNNMQIMYGSDIREKRIRINTLMARDPQTEFEIDTLYTLQDYSALVFDSAFFYQRRSDLKALDRSIQLSELKQESERQSLRPQFGVRYDHMFGFGGLPMQFSLMGMVKIPFAGWSSKMNKANIESLKWKTMALQAEKEMMYNEYRGMTNDLLNEIDLKKEQLKLYEEKIIPALWNNFKTMQLGYEENTEELFMLYDAWEVLNMTQLEYTELLGRVLQLQVELERTIELK